MKKVVYHGVRDIRIEEGEELQPGKGQLFIITSLKLNRSNLHCH